MRRWPPRSVGDRADARGAVDIDCPVGVARCGEGTAGVVDVQIAEEGGALMIAIPVAAGSSRRVAGVNSCGKSLGVSLTATRRESLAAWHVRVTASVPYGLPGATDLYAGLAVVGCQAVVPDRRPLPDGIGVQSSTVRSSVRRAGRRTAVRDVHHSRICVDEYLGRDHILTTTARNSP